MLGKPRPTALPDGSADWPSVPASVCLASPELFPVSEKLQQEHEDHQEVQVET